MLPSCSANDKRGKSDLVTFHESFASYVSVSAELKNFIPKFPWGRIYPGIG